VRRNRRSVAAVVAPILMGLAVLSAVLMVPPSASAQDTDQIVAELEEFGYYIEQDGFATDAEMRSLVAQAERTGDQWYFVVLSGPADLEYAADLRDQVRPTGNVLLHFEEEDSQGIIDNVDFATGSTEAIEEQALSAFDGNWERPADYMEQVVADFTSLTSGGTTGGTTGAGTADNDSGGGSGFLWWLIGIPVVGGGILWFLNRRSKKRKEKADIETARKIRTELQSELDELANDVLVLSGPIDVSDKPEAIEHYRAATDTYLTISDEIPDLEELRQADLAELADVGLRVAHARWQMDAAEAILDGEPVPEKPKVEPPPPPTPPPTRTIEEQRQRLPQRQPRPRVSYSRSRSRSGGGLLDILIAGGALSSSRRRSSGRSTGSSSRTTRSSTPRPGGGVFGGGRASSSSRSRSTGRSRTRTSRRPSGSRSTSKRRRR